MNTVAIIGVGLIGGSFGLALRKAGFEGELIGVSSKPALEVALARGAISETASLAEAAARANLIYLAQPVDRILETLGKLASLARPGCLVTDAGSTKAAIVQRASECLPKGSFLGGHPMAGKEQSGVQAADPDLFRNRPYVLTPTSSTSAESKVSRQFRDWLTRIGANVIEITPSEHDATVAFTSHLPQLISTALAETLGKQDKPRLTQVFGSGLVDMTRLALSPPDLWLSIFATNRAAVIEAVDVFIDSLGHLRESILEGNPTHHFEAACRFAEMLRKPVIT